MDIDIISYFLDSEICDKDLYDAIVYFINSYDIRRGEFEGNEFIITKLDRGHFILYMEYTNAEGEIIDIPPYALPIRKEKLLKAINERAKQKDFI